MIQRLQSCSLLLAAVFILLGIGQISFLSTEHTEKMTDTCFYGAIVFRVIGALIALFSCIAIFRYKSRKCQIGICTINIVLLVLLVGSQALLYFFHGVGGSELQELFPFLSLLCTFDARHRIKKDEALVRAADRLR